MILLMKSQTEAPCPALSDSSVPCHMCAMWLDQIHVYLQTGVPWFLLMHFEVTTRQKQKQEKVLFVAP